MLAARCHPPLHDRPSEIAGMLIEIVPGPEVEVGVGELIGHLED